MKYYKNLDVFVTDLKPAEVSYDEDTGKATIIAATEADAERGIVELEAHGIDLGVEELDEYRCLMLNAFDRATDDIENEELKEEAHLLTKAYYGFNVKNDNPLFAIMTGFLLGVNEGIGIAEALRDASQ